MASPDTNDSYIGELISLILLEFKSKWSDDDDDDENEQEYLLQEFRARNEDLETPVKIKYALLIKKYKIYEQPIFH